MKIACTTYPFMGLPATLRPAAAREKDELPRGADVSFPAAGLPPVTIKYLQTIEQMTSEIMNMTGETPGIEVNDPLERVFAGVPPRPAITGDDVLIFLPPTSSAEDGEGRPGELIVVKAVTYSPSEDGEEISQEEVLTVLARDVARKVSIFTTGLSAETLDPDSRQTRERFIISVDTVDGVSVPSIIYHDPAGGMAVPDERGGGRASITVPAEVTRIASFLTGVNEEVSMDDLPFSPVESAATAEGEDRAVDGGGEASGTAVRSVLASLLADPAQAAREMGRAVSRFFSGDEDLRNEPQGMGAQGNGVEKAHDPAGSAAPAVKPAGNAVTFIGARQTVDILDGASGESEKIPAKMAALAGVINGFSAESAAGVEEAADDAPAAAPAGHAAVKAAMKREVAASFAGALRSAFGMNGFNTAEPFGIALDQNGLLAVDRAVLRDSLSGNKGETLRFVHDLTSSLHDRISHNAYAFAAVYARVDEAALDAPHGKDQASGDDTERKIELEKRLNELQMLLRSSYELKDSFMNRKSAVEDR